MTSTAPGPTPLDMIRAVPRIRRDAPGFLLDCQRRWGDVVLFPMPRTPAFLVSSPAGARRVLQDNHRGYDKETIQYRTLAMVTGEGLLTSDGDLWRRQRRIVQPAFHARTLGAVAEHTAAAADRMLARWDAGDRAATIDIDDQMMRVTLDVVTASLFGDANRGPEASVVGDGADVVAAVLAGLDVVVARARAPWAPPRRVPTPNNRRLARSLATLDATVAALVDRREREPEPERSDLLELLLRARDADSTDDPGDAGEPGGVARRRLRDEVVTLLVAGHETVASALTWAWWLLSRHPQARAAVQAEVDGAGAGAGAPARLDDLPYTRAVVDETLRLYPPAWVVSRRALADDVVDGTPIPAGSLVLVSPWVVHRHLDAWADPERFDPSRFLPGGTLDRRAYLPFGAGPRLCVGRNFALVEATLLLARVAASYSVQVVDGAVGVDALVTLRPRGGMAARVSRRAEGGIPSGHRLRSVVRREGIEPPTR